MTDTTGLPIRSAASCLQGFGERRSISVVASSNNNNNISSRSSSSMNNYTTNNNKNNSNINNKNNDVLSAGNNNNYSNNNNNNNSNTGMGGMGTSDGRSFRVRLAQSTSAISKPLNTTSEQQQQQQQQQQSSSSSRFLLEETDIVNYRRGYSSQREEQEERMDGEDAYAQLRHTLETTLRDREKELAAALQREKTLASRLRVAEETRVLYQLYTQRLLELMRLPELTPTLPLVKNSDVVEALREAIHNGEMDIIMNEEDIPTQASHIDGVISTRLTSSSSSSSSSHATTPASSIQLTNATLLTSAMLESKVTNCLVHLKRENARRQERIMQTVQTASNTYVEEMESKLALLSNALRQVEQRVAEHAATTTVALQRHVRHTQNNGMCIEQQQQELRRLQQECVRYQREQQRTQAEMTALKDELARLDGDRETALIMHRAAECLEDVRQSVRNAVRGAAHAIEQSALESNTLKEPFIQSIRVIAVKVEAHADMARTAVRRWQQESTSTSTSATARDRFTSDVDLDAVHRLLLSPPRRSTRSCEHPPLLHRDDSVGNSNLMMLEELSRVMKNLCRLLENNARQMEANTMKVTKSISDWEKAIVKQMTEIWECMRVGLLEQGILSPTSSTQHRQLCGEAPLTLGDHYTEISTTPTHTHSNNMNNNNNNNNIIHNSSSNHSNSSNPRGSTIPLSQASCATTTTSAITTVAAAPTKVMMGRNGSFTTSCGQTQSTSVGVPSYTSSTNASRAASAMPSFPPSWHIPPAPLSEVERTPDTQHRHRDNDFLSPPSISVSRAPTPPPAQSLSQSQLQSQSEGTQTIPTGSNLFQQQDRVVEISPYKVLSPGRVSSTVPRLHYAREIENVESNITRVGSGAILPRRTHTLS